MDWTVFGTSVLTGLISSICLILLSLLFKPRLLISKKIAKQIDSRGSYYYAIKVINLTGVTIKNIDVTWEILNPTNVPGGVIHESIPLQLRRERHLIGGTRDHKLYDFFIFNTTEDLESKWSDEQHMFVSFKIYCENSISSVGKLYTVRYNHKTADIVKGKFKYGCSNKIIEE